eukprot:6208045-Pleurochrysis_carterae.AAC.1
MIVHAYYDYYLRCRGLLPYLTLLSASSSMDSRNVADRNKGRPRKVFISSRRYCRFPRDSNMARGGDFNYRDKNSYDRTKKHPSQ